MRITPLGAPPPERFSNGGAQLEISWILEPQFCMDHPRRWYHHAFRSSSGLSSSPNRPRSHQLLLIASLSAIVCVGAVARGVEIDLRRPFVNPYLLSYIQKIRRSFNTSAPPVQRSCERARLLIRDVVSSNTIEIQRDGPLRE